MGKPTHFPANIKDAGLAPDHSLETNTTQTVRKKKKNTRSQAVLARRSAIGSISAALAREHLESFGGRSCNEAMAGHIVTRLGLPWIFADFAVYPVIFRFCVIKQGLVYQVYHMIFPRFRQINGKLRGTM